MCAPGVRVRNPVNRWLVSGCGPAALGFWAQPRGTLDVDVTLFVPPSQPSECLRTLQDIGCSVGATNALHSLKEHGFCQVEYACRRVDVFIPLIPFYEKARKRRQRVDLGGQPIMIWDAESLCVFKMMFFRRRDLADLEQVLQLQGDQLDCAWVNDQLREIYGSGDPRVAQWQELVQEVRGG